MSLSTIELQELPIKALTRLLKEKKISSQELCSHYFERIKTHQELAVFLDLNQEVTQNQASACDARIKAGQAAVLEGVPIAHKDIFVTRDFVTTAGSNMLANYRSPFDATVVSKLAASGCVSLGKLSCDEFAMGSGNENVAVPDFYSEVARSVRNPWDLNCIPGGSSGGSAAAVAARLCVAATGTDTGGSIRQPAAFCGITGIKPTYGLVSRYGMVAFASSLDQAGPMAKSAEDCAYLLSSMCGADVLHDSTSLDVPAVDYTRSLDTTSMKGVKIGVPQEFFAEGLDVEIVKAIEACLSHYKKLGAQVVEISLPNAHLSLPVYYIIAPAEASSNLSRFDGVRYGHRASQYDDLVDMYCKSRAEGFGAEVKRRIMMGTYVLSHGYYDAYYLQAQKIRRLIAQDFTHAFTKCDVIAAPIAPTVAWKIGEKLSPMTNYLSDIYTLPASLAGLPAMSLPVGFSEHNMPIGMQLIAPHFKESQLLGMAHRFQLETDFHQQKPKGF